MASIVALPLLIALFVATTSCGPLGSEDDEGDAIATEIAGAVRATQVADAVQATLDAASPTPTPTLVPTRESTEPPPTSLPTPTIPSPPTRESVQEVDTDFRPSSIHDLLANEADLARVYSPLKFLLYEDEVVTDEAPQAWDGFVDGRVLTFDVYNFELLESEFFVFEARCHEYADTAAAREWLHLDRYVSEDVADEFVEAEDPELGEASIAGTFTSVGEETLHGASVWVQVDEFACVYTAWGDIPPDAANVVEVVETKLHTR